jgi:hypothetical protein
MALSPENLETAWQGDGVRSSRKSPGLALKSGRGASLNIKNTETARMVRELAALEGVSLVVAVTEAVREKLEKEKAEREAVAKTKKGRYELLMEFAKECGPLFKDGRSGNDLINDLYDDMTGLPK